MKTVFFDLDGTLWSPLSVVLPAYRETFAELGLPVPDDRVLSDTFGYPLDEIWQRLLPGADANERRHATRLMSAAEQKQLLAGDGRPYPAVDRVLTELRARGCQLCILSNCGVDYLRSVPDQIGIGHHFSARYCAEQFPGKTKAEILAEVLPQKSLPAAMVGDRWHDIQAGKENSLLTIGCSYGLGKAEELVSADHRIHDFSELLGLLF